MRLVRYTVPTSYHRVPAPGAGFRSPWVGLDDEINRLFAAAFDGVAAAASPRFPVDVFEDAASTIVRAELPGVRREEIGVELAEGGLTISVTPRPRANAEASAPAETTGPAEPTWRRTVTLDAPVDAAKVAAALEHGILTVTLPKPAAVAPRQITVAVT